MFSNVAKNDDDISRTAGDVNSLASIVGGDDDVSAITGDYYLCTFTHCWLLYRTVH